MHQLTSISYKWCYMVLHGRQSRHVFRRRCTTLALHLLAGLNGMVLHLFCQLQHTLVYLDESELQIHWRKSPHCFPPGPLWNFRRISWRHGCIVNFKAGGVRHHPICHRPGGCFLDHANLPPSWTTSGCWGCKNLWAKRCCNWWLLSLSNSRFLLGS